jgi:hypothetical protein
MHRDFADLIASTRETVTVTMSKLKMMACLTWWGAI